MAENNYATKQDFQELKRDFQELRAHVDARFDQIVEATRDMQTEVLRAFHNWARPTTTR